METILVVILIGAIGLTLLGGMTVYYYLNTINLYRR